MRLAIQIVALPHHAGLELPTYASAGAAGMDLRAATPADKPLILPPGGRALVSTGLVIAVPEGFEAQVRPRSGLALKFGVTCLNAPGTVDSDYRGEVGVILANLGAEPFTVSRGDRIAQLVIAAYAQVEWTMAVSHAATERGAAGFGSTGQE